MKNQFTFSLIIIILIGAVVGCSSDETSRMKYYVSCQSNPDSPAKAYDYLKVSENFLAEVNFGCAEGACEESLRRFPNDAFSYECRAKFRIARRNFPAAVEDYNYIIAMKPDNSVFLLQRSQLHFRMDNMTAALSDADAAVAAGKQKMEHLMDKSYFAHVYSWRGYVRLRNREYERAVNDFDRAIELSPDWFSFYEDRAEARRGLGQIELAGEDERKGKELKLADKNRQAIETAQRSGASK